MADGLGRKSAGNIPCCQRLVAPGDLVEEFVDPLSPREQCRARRPLHRIPVQTAQFDPVRGVEPQVSREYFGLALSGVADALPHAGMADDAFRQRPGQPQPLPSEGEVRPGLLAARHVPGHGQYLEATVEQDRVRLQAASVHRCWQHDFPDRLAVADPCRLKRAEPRAEVDADVRPRTVERRNVLRRQACLQRGEVDSGRGLSLPAGLRRALCVQRPAFFTLAPAVYLEVA